MCRLTITDLHNTSMYRVNTFVDFCSFYEKNVQWNELNSLSKALCVSKLIWNGCVERVHIIQIDLNLLHNFPLKAGVHIIQVCVL